MMNLFGQRRHTDAAIRRLPRGKSRVARRRRRLGIEALEPRQLLSQSGLELTGRLTYQLSASRYSSGVATPIGIAGAEVLVSYLSLPVPGERQTTLSTSPVYTDADGDYTILFSSTNAFQPIAAASATFTVIAQAAPTWTGRGPLYSVKPSLGGSPFQYSVSLTGTHWFNNSGGPPQFQLNESINVTPQQMVPGQPGVSYANVFDVFRALTTGYWYYNGLLGHVPATGVSLVYTTPESKQAWTDYNYQSNTIFYYYTQVAPNYTWDVVLHGRQKGVRTIK
jgi:hypothetical protein